MKFWDLISRGYFNGSPTYLYFSILVMLFVVGYACGSLNFAIIISKKYYGEDIRKVGSKNAGFTNMLRIYGKKAAALTMLGDFLKTFIICLAGRFLLGDSGACIAGLGCVIGHAFPVYYGFRGGKGVLATASMLLVLNPIVLAFLLIIFIIIVAATKYVSLGSIMCALIMPLLLSKLGESNVFVIIPGLIITVLVVFLHRENIKRLLEGTESKLNLKK
ncbi:MAG: glycerol-3-phosphate 1-O-acyltransferase PlsY [Clostridia bacterium]|nr:glycerol-3-phosphate 1-O-acyltransferase PlsY [Clostridia bacterium]